MKNRPNHAVQFLWWVYGHTYDGLLHFYPYTMLVKAVVAQANIQTHERVLDLGCGTGNVLMQIVPKTSNSVVGVDISGSMLAVARRKLAKYAASGQLRLQHQSVLEFLKVQPNEAFDNIVTTNVIYALDHRDQVWRELMRVLARSGQLTVATSVKTGSRSLIKEQLEHNGVIRSLHPRLIGVFIIDSIIDLFVRVGEFEFPNEATVRKEVAAAGGVISNLKPCYAGVDILFTVHHSDETPILH